jgi:acyl-CoA synthetase (AMP-forming)/AMP-acid ligase II/aryl carrier-like protein
MAARSTLVDCLTYRSERHPDRIAYRFLTEGTAAGPALEWTYAQLAARAGAVAAALTERELAGAPVLLLYPSGLPFVAAFLGCLQAGALAVPAYPPDPSRLARTLPRLQSIAADAGARAVLTTAEIAGLSTALSALAPDLASLEWLPTDTLPDATAPSRASAAGIAFLQYTSGSTSAPKGVIVTHANLMHNEQLLCEHLGLQEEISTVGWLPLFHDMGLVGHVLAPLFAGGTSTLMAPQDFLRRPLEWLRAISRFGALASGGPDFAYAACARKADPAALQGMDLSRWRVAYTGAETVRPATLEAFTARFAPCGFRPSSWLPTYGLAEATLMVTCGEPGAVTTREGRVSVGRPRDFEMCLVDPQTGEPVADGQTGEIWVRGPSVTRGYWGRAELTASTFEARTSAGEGPFLRTGDLGVRVEGELFVAGRLKDLVIVRGRNLYPEDIEQTVETCHPALRAGGTAAFAVEVDGEELVGVACEVEDSADLQAVAEAVRMAISSGFDAPVHGVALLPRRALPKTSSGKRQRSATRQGYLEGTLEERGRVVFAQSAPAPAQDEPPPATAAELEGWLARQIAPLVGRSPGELHRDSTFDSMGLDSVRATELAAGLEPRLGRPLHPTIFYNVPTIGQLAAWLVDGGRAPAPPGPPVLYPRLEEALSRLERRNIDTYRFDLDKDIPWDRVDEPGEYVPLELFSSLGLELEVVRAQPEAWRLLQIASAITMCQAFETVEVTIGLFIDTRWAQLGHSKSLGWFREEETKHVRLFRRYAEVLEQRHPELLVDLGWDRSWGVGFWELFKQPDLFPDERVFHYLFWFFFVSFEEHSIYIADALRQGAGVQPAWLAAHEAHRREELQHVATDHAYVGALDLGAAERDAWSEVCVAWLCQHFETFFAFGPARRLVARRFPQLVPHLRSSGFVRSPFLGDLLTAPAFRRTRLSCPYLRALQDVPADRRPSDVELASRLPAAWLDGRTSLPLPDPVEAK